MATAVQTDHGPNDLSITAEAIGDDFVAVRRQDLIAREVDGALVVAEPETGVAHVLNSTGSLLWELFDGSTSIAGVTSEISEEYGLPLDQVRTDILGLARALGQLGLLQGVIPGGVAEPEEVVAVRQFEIGDELQPFRLVAAGGGEADLATLRGRRVLLVNWSPTCGYCAAIVSDLAEASAASAQHGLEIVLLTSGDEGTNLEMLAGGGVTATIALRESADDAFEDPFPAMGTPVAYLLDEDGKVAEDLAYGANAVPALARRAAGLPDRVDGEAAGSRDNDGPDGPRFLAMPGASDVCGPGPKRKPRVWAATSSYRFGDSFVGIRADSVETDRLLGRLFAEHRIEDLLDPPAQLSVILPGGHDVRTKELNLLLIGDRTAVRSRSPRRIVLALASYLSAFTGTESISELLPIAGLPLVKNDRALLLPVVGDWLGWLGPRLGRLGYGLADDPRFALDVGTGELVIPEFTVKVDPEVFAELPEWMLGGSEGPPVPPGRYPLDAIAIWGSDHGDRARNRASAVGAIFGLIMDRRDPGEKIDCIRELLERVPVTSVGGDDPAEFLDEAIPRLEALVARRK